MDMVQAIVKRSKESINFDLDGYDSLTIVASKMLEEGYYLLVEGDPDEVNELMEEWREMGVLLKENEVH